MVIVNQNGNTRDASRMPLQIVQGGQYMNDAVGSVFGRFTLARHYQKKNEFRGGIWDCENVEEAISAEPLHSDTPNGTTNQIFSLEEILACDNDENETEMQDDDPESLQNELADNNAVSFDVKNKRWRSEEFDKAWLPCSDTETNRKKAKKTVSFVDTLIYVQNSEQTDTVIETKSLDKYAGDNLTIKMEDDASKETVKIKRNEQPKNSPNMVSQNSNDAAEEIERTVAQKLGIKISSKVKNWVKLASYSSEISLSDPHSNGFKEPSMKIPLASKVKCTTKQDINKKNFFAEHDRSSEKCAVALKLQSDEIKNRNHLEVILPELFEVSEIKTTTINRKSDILQKSSIMKLKDKMSEETERSSNVRIVKQKIKTASEPCEKNSVLKGTHSQPQTALPKESQTSVDDCYTKESFEIRLKNLLSERITDSDDIERITQFIKLTEQNKNDPVVEKKLKNTSSGVPSDFVSVVKQDKVCEEKYDDEQMRHADKFLEDKSQYIMEHYDKQKEKLCCPTEFEKPSCKQQSLPEAELEFPLLKDTAKPIANQTEDKSGNILPPSFIKLAKQNNLGNPVFSSRNDSCQNWREQCADVREKKNCADRNSLVNWRNGCKDSKNQHQKTSRDNYNADKTSTEMDTSPKDDFLETDTVKVVPLNLKEPPDPLSRFKGINSDPESIWDIPDEKAPHTAIYHKQSDCNIDLKSNQKTKEFHAQIFRNSKTTTVPRFFDSPTKTAFAKAQVDGYSSPKKTENSPLVKLTGNCRSRSQLRRENYAPHRPYERNRSSSTHWRSPYSISPVVEDVFLVIKIVDDGDGATHKFEILKDYVIELKRQNKKLSDIIPNPGCRPQKILYSSSAVKMFLRCVFSMSYKIPSWKTALEGFALADKCGVVDLKAECEAYFSNYKIPSEEIEQVAICARQLNAINVLKSKIFEQVENIKSSSDQNVYLSQSCSVRCTVLKDPLEFAIPLLSDFHRGLESCNESDVKNSVFFSSLGGVSCLTGIQMKFLTEDIRVENEELHIACEVFRSGEQLLCKELDTKCKSSVKISFEEEINVNLRDEIEISVVIDDVLLRICPQLMDKEFISPGKFQMKFESSKTSGRNKLFCIEKIFYTS